MVGSFDEDTILDEFDQEEPVFLATCPKCSYTFSVDELAVECKCPRCRFVFDHEASTEAPEPDDDVADTVDDLNFDDQ
ncbi:TPA: hypothetical protein DF272_01300 [Candidatus Falkowbacteria bacterium]|nr:hypothetical protein [Candidatus Falkowbacteria bacterium]